jgi:hypothetical protein
MTGLNDHYNPDGEKIEEGTEGGEGGRTHARDFERASYVWCKLRRLCCRGANGGRGWINAGCPR